MRQTDDGEAPSLVSMMKLTTLTCCCFAIAGSVTLRAQSSETTTKTVISVPDGNAISPTTSIPGSRLPTTNMPPRISPQQHLTDARGVLAGVSEKSLPMGAQKKLAQLRNDFSALASSYTEPQPETPAWRLTFSDVERDLVPLIGGGGPMTLTDDPAAIPWPRADRLDSATRVVLEAFRTHVELFYDAAMAPEPRGVTPPSVRASSF